MIPCKTCGKKGWILNPRGAGVRCPACGGMRYIDEVGERLEEMEQSRIDELKYLKGARTFYPQDKIRRAKWKSQSLSQASIY